MEGWLFDLYTKSPGQMIIWLKTPYNGALKLVDQWRPSFYVAAKRSDLEYLSSRLTNENRIEEWYERVESKRKTSALRVFYDGRRDCENAKRTIVHLGGSEQKYRIYNLDIPPDQLYLYEKDLFPLAHVEVDESGSGLDWKLLDSAYDVNYSIPSLKIMLLAVIVSKQDPSSNKKFSDPLEKIILQIDNNRSENFSIDSGCEKDKLLRLMEIVQHEDPDIIVTEEGDSFQLPYLGWRAKANNLSHSFYLGRESSQKTPEKHEGSSYVSYGHVYYRASPVRLMGRFHLDRENAFVYDDCGLQGLFEISRSCRIPLSRASRSTIGTSMNSLQMYTAYRDRFLIPWQKDTPENFKTVSELLIADRGGFIFEPKIGLHEGIGELDYSSLYPMLMYSRNISPETISCKCCPDSLESVPELGYKICQRRTGIVSKSLAILLTKRQAYKNLRKTSNSLGTLYKQRSDALKWILVCSFGYLGFKNARFGKIDAHISVCAFSRDILTRTERFVRERRYQLLHGIVDSTWLKNQDAAPSDYEELARDLEGYFGLPISFEGIYRWIVFLPSKVFPNRPVLNRYYGIFSDGTLKVRGIAVRRHDTPKIVENLQSEVLKLLGTAGNIREFRSRLPETLEIFRRHVKLVQSGTVSLNDLVIRKNLSKEPSQYSNLVPQALAAKQLKLHGFEVNAGRTIGYVLLEGDEKNSKHVVADELTNESQQYSREDYTSLLIDGFAEILSPMGFGKEKLAELAPDS